MVVICSGDCFVSYHCGVGLLYMHDVMINPFRSGEHLAKVSEIPNALPIVFQTLVKGSFPGLPIRLSVKLRGVLRVSLLLVYYAY